MASSFEKGNEIGKTTRFEEGNEIGKDSRFEKGRRAQVGIRLTSMDREKVWQKRQSPH